MWSRTNTGRHSITLLRVIKRACPHCGLLPRETGDDALRAALKAVLLDWMTWMPHDKLDLPSAIKARELVEMAPLTEKFTGDKA